MAQKKSLSNAEYWDLRSGQEQLAKYLKDADMVIKGMESAYKDIFLDLMKDVEAFYGRVMTEEGFNRYEAEKNIDYGKRHLKELEAFIDHFDAIGGTDPALINQYKAIARANHMTRFELLEAQINANAARLAMVQEERAAEHLQKIAREGYFETMYAEYRKGNPGVLKLMAKGGVKISQKAVKEIVWMNWAGANFSDAIWHREFDLADKIKRAVMRNVVQGMSIDKCAAELRQFLDMDLHYAAERLVRTETAHVHTILRKKIYEETGVKQYRYMANLDSRTSKICADLHGKVFALEDAKTGVNLPPMHPNCRSDIHAEYDEPLIKDKEYRMKMPDGKYKTVPLDMEKDAWMEAYGEKVESKPHNAYNKKRTRDGRYPIKQADIDNLLGDELNGIKFSAKPTYSPRLKSNGATTASMLFSDPDSNAAGSIRSIKIGPQSVDTKEFLMDTLIHEELEARIMLRDDAYNYMSDVERHAYIDKVIERFFSLKGWNYDTTK